MAKIVIMSSKGLLLNPNSSSKGKWAEGVVKAYLQKQGWRILCMNYKAASAEADIIAIDGKELVLVEVKSGYQDHDSLAEKINRNKRYRLEQVIVAFQIKHQLQDYAIRFDVITVSLPNGSIHHFKKEFFDD